jgi:hypothetical protein
MGILVVVDMARFGGLRTAQRLSNAREGLEEAAWAVLSSTVDVLIHISVVVQIIEWLREVSRGSRV